MEKKKLEEHDNIIDLNNERIKKNIFKQTDPDCKDAVEDFLRKYKDDTLTGV